MSRSLYARLARRYRPKPIGWNRREFLQATLAASAGLLVSCSPTLRQRAKVAPHGRKVVIVANLAPRKLRGLESQGMILAASLPDGSPVLAAFLEDIEPGARLK